jgi:hypothetical protein
LQQAANSVVAGDTVDVEPGTYAGFVMGWNNPQNGTSAAPITWNAQPGVVVDSRDNETADGIDLEYCSFIVINGFTVTNSDGSITRAGIRAAGQSEGDVIENNDVSDCGTWAIFTAFANGAQILNNVASNSQTQHGIYVSNSSDYDVVKGNTVFGNADCGIQFNGDASQGGDGIMSHAVIQDNIIYNNGANGGSAINCDGVQNSLIANNLLYDNHASGISLFQEDGGGPSSNDVVVNNTIVNAADSRWSLNIQNGGVNDTAYNNILYNANPAHGSISISSDSLPGFKSDYNIVVNAFTTDGGDSVQTLTQWQAATGQDKHSKIATPSQIFVNAAANNYLELPTSPSIDAGTALDAPNVDILGNPRPAGHGFDIGCYEYQTKPVVPPVVTLSKVKVVTNSKHLVTEVQIVFGGPVDSAEAGKTSFYRLATPGTNGSYTAKNAGIIRLKKAQYVTANHTVDLTPVSPFSLAKPVQLEVFASRPSGLKDTVGRFINRGMNAFAILK